MISYYLGESPILPNVETFLLAEREQRDHVLERLDRMVVKPTDEAGGKGVFVGPTASDEEVERRRAEILREPARWIGQETVALSTVPTQDGGGGLAARHVDLRPFAIFGEDIRIVPCGLTRVALREGSLIVNSSQGGGSKDTWVLEEAADLEEPPPAQDPYDPPTMPGLRSPAGGAPDLRSG
jgi:uncharacterized circularly permuted ATP-grasp superfamily protein